jgi:hypothetical protein
VNARSERGGLARCLGHRHWGNEMPIELLWRVSEISARAQLKTSRAISRLSFTWASK